MENKKKIMAEISKKILKEYSEPAVDLYGALGLPTVNSENGEGTDIPDLGRMGSVLIGGCDKINVMRAQNSILAKLILGPISEKCHLIAVLKDQSEVHQSGVLPHMPEEVISERRKAVNRMRKLVDEMDARYCKMEELHERSFRNAGFCPIVLIISELSELSPVKGTAFESHLMHLLSKGRAAGIYCIIGTSTPSQRLLSEPLRSNIGTRIAFRVNTKLESEYLLGCEDAEKLKWNDDVLVKFPWDIRPRYIRISQDN